MPNSKHRFYNLGYPGLVAMTRDILSSFRTWKSFERAQGRFLDAYIDWVGHADSERAQKGDRWLVSCIRSCRIREADLQRISHRYSEITESGDSLLTVFTCRIKPNHLQLFKKLLNEFLDNELIIIDENILEAYTLNPLYSESIYPYTELISLYSNSLKTTQRNSDTFIYPFGRDVGYFPTPILINIIGSRRKTYELNRIDHNLALAIVYERYYAVFHAPTKTWDAYFSLPLEEIAFTEIKQMQLALPDCTYGIVELQATLKAELVHMKLLAHTQAQTPIIEIDSPNSTLIVKEWGGYNFVFYPLHRKKDEQIVLAKNRSTILIDNSDSYDWHQAGTEQITLTF